MLHRFDPRRLAISWEGLADALIVLAAATGAAIVLHWIVFAILQRIARISPNAVDDLVVAAVRDAYRGFLDGKLHAAVFLHLDTAPDLVDVNVHPTKAEVRFRRDQEVFATVRRAIRAALEGSLGTGLLEFQAELLGVRRRVGAGIRSIGGRCGGLVGPQFVSHAGRLSGRLKSGITAAVAAVDAGRGEAATGRGAEMGLSRGNSRPS